MTDKVQKILNEITTRKLCTMDEHMAFYNDKAKEDYKFLSEIEELIKALQEEPVSEDFKEFEVEYFEREKDNIVCVYDRHAGLVDGAKWQKERMSKQVLDATIHPSDGEIWVDCIFDLAPFKEDEKVKVIIIKQE